MMMTVTVAEWIRELNSNVATKAGRWMIPILALARGGHRNIDADIGWE
jgi:hypothetical protein